RRKTPPPSWYWFVSDSSRRGSALQPALDRVPEPDRILRRMASHIVVEIGKHRNASSRAGRQPLSPLIEGLIAVAAAVLCGAVKPHVHERAGRHSSGSGARHIVEA